MPETLTDPTPDALTMAVAAAHRANRGVVHGDIWLHSLAIEWWACGSGACPVHITVAPTLHTMPVTL